MYVHCTCTCTCTTHVVYMYMYTVLYCNGFVHLIFSLLLSSTWRMVSCCESLWGSQTWTITQLSSWTRPMSAHSTLTSSLDSYEMYGIHSTVQVTHVYPHCTVQMSLHCTSLAAQGMKRWLGTGCLHMCEISPSLGGYSKTLGIFCTSSTVSVRGSSTVTRRVVVVVSPLVSLMA